jgi:hypothetical protein
MARSHYKARGLGKLPMCLICAGPGRGVRAEVTLTHGVRVWLCEAHRSPEFLRARAGRDFAASLLSCFRAAGCLSGRRSAAIDAHLRRVREGARARGRPGSYGWPRLRDEAEARFARGERPQQVIDALRARHAGGQATPPSVRTMRRWHAEGRWLAPPPPPPSRPSPPTPPPPPAGGPLTGRPRRGRVSLRGPTPNAAPPSRRPGRGAVLPSAP